MKEGPCTENKPAFFFDSKTGQCSGFTYGGCEGNANRFESKEQCQRQCGRFKNQDVCSFEKDFGPCLGRFKKYHYNQNLNQCEEFTFGGCEGNGNRFSSVTECEKICLAREEPEVESQSAVSKQTICKLPFDTGLPTCNDQLRRWYFDADYGSCSAFIYSGCAGNQNRFKTFEVCMGFCQATSDTQPPSAPNNAPAPDIYSQPDQAQSNAEPPVTEADIEDKPYDPEACKASDDRCNYAKTSGGQTTITEGNGKITSENYPSRYPSNQECSWQLSNSDNERYIEVTVQRVDADCRDRLIVNPKSSRSYSLCRVRRPLKFTDPTKIDISFTSDNRSEKKGFSLSYTFKSAFFMCNGPDALTVNSRGVKIQSENYPRLYSASSQCRWHIKVEDQAARHIAFYIRMFRTERSSKCDRNNDNLVIFDAADCNTETLQTAPIWGSLCGYKRRGHFYTSLKSACFAFIADGDSRKNRGFQLQLYQK